MAKMTYCTSIALSPTSLVGGNAVVITVYISKSAPTGGLAVALQSSNTTALTLPASVVIPVNKAHYSFTFPTSTVAATTAVTVTATLVQSRSVNLTVTAGATTTATCATPSFSPAAGSYSSAQSVSLTCSTSGVAIHYTTDGSTPTSSSSVYSSPISVGSSMTVKAMATKTGYNNSAVGSASYTISVPATPTCATPTLSPAGGTYTSTRSVTLACATSGATIYYTLDGSTPTTASFVYTGAISIPVTTTVKAMAAALNYLNSVVGSATYTISTVGSTTPTFSDDFSTGTLNTTKWGVSSGTWPGTNKMVPTNVDLTTGMLRIKLVVGTDHEGGEVYSKSTFGYGTYEWVIRTSSSSTTPDGSGSGASGSVSAGFNYVNNSQTEIDCVEVTGDNRGHNNMTSWTNDTTEETSSVSVSPACDQAFHVYKMVWSASKIDFYLDGVLVHTNTKVLPTTPANIYINHWVGSTNWGGSPVNQTSYMYCKSVKFWAA